jgi:hypothetical protein
MLCPDYDIPCVAKCNLHARSSLPTSGAIVAKKNNTSVRREWTATEIHKLKGLAKKRVGLDKIARTLNRSVEATAMKASSLGISLDTRG